VIAELLGLIIESDELSMTVSELEGDAVFFYRHGRLPDFEALVGQARRTFEAFHSHLRVFESQRICECGACRGTQGLSLKIVAHAGPIELISVHGFEKPYGSDVIVAHRLLKNDLKESEYLLVTKSALSHAEAPPKPPDWSVVGGGSLLIDNLGSVDYHYVPLAPLRKFVSEPPPLPVFEKMKNPIVLDTFIERAPSDVYELVSNLDMRLSWNRGVDELKYDRDRVNRVGTEHRCVIGAHLFDFRTITNDFGEGDLVYGEHSLENPLVDNVEIYYIVAQEGTGTRLRFETHYRPKPFPSSLLAFLFRFRFTKLGAELLDGVKVAAERGGSVEG